MLLYGFAKEIATCQIKGRPCLESDGMQGVLDFGLADPLSCWNEAKDTSTAKMYKN